MNAGETLLRNLRLGNLYAASAACSDLTLIYAYSQIADDTPLTRRSVVAWRYVEKFSQSAMSTAAIREIMTVQEQTFPAEKVWVFRAGELGDRKFFKQNAANLIYLRHPQLTLLYDARFSGENSVTPLAILEPLENFSPAENSNLTVPRKISGLQKIFAAMQFLHAQSFCHGDLRPDNLWFSADAADAKLLLTGIIPSLAAVKDQHFSPALFGYTAPEILSGGALSIATEIYALGGCLYFLATGQHPFATAAGLPEFLQQARAGINIPPEIPSRLASIIACAMTVNPDERYGSVAEMAVDVNKFMGDTSVAFTMDLPVEKVVPSVSDQRAVDSQLPLLDVDLFDQNEPVIPKPLTPSSISAKNRARSIWQNVRRIRLWKNIAIAVVIFSVFLCGAYLLSGDRSRKKIDDTALVSLTAADDDFDSNSNNMRRNEIRISLDDPIDNDLPAFPETSVWAAPIEDDHSAPVTNDSNKLDGSLAADTTLLLDTALPELSVASSATSLAPAASLMAEGNELVKQRNYAAALIKFEAATRLNPSPELRDELTALIQATKISQEKLTAQRNLLEEAQSLIAASKFEDAENLLTTLAAENPTNAEIEKKLAIARTGRFNAAFADAEKEMAAKNYEAAELAFAWALSIDGFANEPRALQGREKARAAMAAVPSVSEQQSSYDAAMKEAQNLLAKKDYHAAVEVFNLALAVAGYENDPDALQGKRLAEAGAREIENSLTNLSVSNSPVDNPAPANAQSHYNELMKRGQALLNAGAWSDSERVFSRALTIPGYAGDRTALAKRQQAIAGQTVTNKQEQTYAQLIAVLRYLRDRDYPAANERLAAAQQNADGEQAQITNEIKKCLPAATGTMAAGNPDFTVQLEQAEMLAEQKQYSDAENAFRQLILQTDRPAALHWAAGVMAAAASKNTAAEQDFDQALAADPNFAPALLSQVSLLLARNAYTVAQQKTEQYQQLADNDSDRATAALLLGYLYYDGGLGVMEKRKQIKVNNERAAEYFSQAAKLGNPQAENNLGVCQLTGRGVKRDYQQARNSLVVAGELPTALFNNGLMYFRGTGISRDYSQAADYFQRAAKLGDRRSAARLADMYQRGRGVAKDDALAKRYLQDAGGELDRDDEFALTLPDINSQFARFKNLPRPAAKKAAAPEPDFAPAYQLLVSLAKQQMSTGKLIAASRNYALALQLPGYLDDTAANQGLTVATAKTQELITAASAPLPVTPAIPTAVADRASAPNNLPDLTMSNSTRDSVPARPQGNPGEPTPERQAFYKQALEIGRKMLMLQNWGYAEQAFLMALVVPGIADESMAVEGLNRALEAKRRLADQVKFTDFEAVLSNATSQLRDKQYLAGAYLYKYALTLEGAKNEQLPQLGFNIAEYEQYYQSGRDNRVISSGSEKDMASYNLALTQAKQFIDDNNFDAAVQLLRNVLQWNDFKNDPAALALLQMAQERLTENENLPEFLAQQREKNRELYDKLIFSGKVYLQEKNWNEADRAFQLAMKLKGYENDAIARRGSEAAKKQQAELRDTASPQTIAELAAIISETRDALKIGNYAKAEELARAALKLPGCEDNADARSLLEAAYQAQGKSLDNATTDLPNGGVAITDWEREHAAQVAQYQAFLGEGRRSFEMGQYEVAEVIFQEVLKLRGYEHDPAALAFLDRIKKIKPKEEEIAPPTPESTAELAGEDNSEQARLLINEGKRAIVAKNYESAVQFFGNAIDLNAQDSEAYYQRGMVRITQNQLELALADLKKAIDTGGLSNTERSDAYNSIANIYYYGAVKNYPEAFVNYKIAAESGNVAAMNSLGVTYFTGRGVEENRATALEWYKKSANNGYANAMLNLGLSYENGWVGEPDFVEARVWYERAAKQNVPRAFARLARLYREGLGVTADANRAIEYRAQAQALGYNADK